MSEEKITESELDRQNYEELRSAIRHFDRVIRAQMKIQGSQGDRVNNSIRAGMLFLVLIGISIFVILVSMVTQVKQISESVTKMDASFGQVKVQMIKVDELMTHMEVNVASMASVDRVMQSMDAEMLAMTQKIGNMQQDVGAMSNELTVIRQQGDSMTHTAGVMDMEIYKMKQEVRRMATPARSINKMFPIP